MAALDLLMQELTDLERAELDPLLAFLSELGAVAFEADRVGDLPASLWDQAPLSLLNRVNVPFAYGGLRMTSRARTRALLFEAVGSVCPAFLMSLPGPGLALAPVMGLGTESQKRWFFDHFQNDRRPVWAAFAMTEPGVGSDATRIQTTAVADGDVFEINGCKCFITNGERADLTVVFATVAPGKGRFGIRAFIVPAGTPGLTIERTENMLGLRASQMTSLRFDRCRIPREYLLGPERIGLRSDAFGGAQDAWNFMRPAMAAGMNGATGALLDWVEHNADSAFIGKDEARRSVYRFKPRLLSARLMAMQAARSLDEGKDATLPASLAKTYAADLANDVADQFGAMFPACIGGGSGRVEKFWRDAKAFDILEGTGDMQRLLIAGLKAREKGRF